MFHGAETSLSRQRSAKRGLKCHLFIGCPLRIYLFIFRHTLGNLRTGRSRIAGDKAAAGLIETSGNRFVAKHQCFHISFSSLSLITDGICHGNRHLLLIAGENLFQCFLPRRLRKHAHYRYNYKSCQHTESTGIDG